MRRTLCLLLVSILACADVTAARAQSLPDASPPVIEHEPVLRGEAGSRQVFTAQVVDDRELLDATLYVRRAGRQAFTPLVMEPLADTAFFSASIETDADDLRAIEYYLQARDAGGNRTVDGFAFDPHVRTLTAPVRAGSSAPTGATADAGTPPPSPARQPERTPIGVAGVPWWQIALGAVAVGVLAAAAGGSGSGGDDERTAPFTVNLAEPE